MNFNHLLLTSIPQKEELIEYGFSNKGDSFSLKKNLNEEFYGVVEYSPGELKAEVYETESDEKYLLLDVKKAQGEFVNNLRSMLADLMDEIVRCCFLNIDVKTKYVEFLEDELCVKGDCPWDDLTAAVYRCKGGKWFALLMKIKFKNLGFESDDPVWVVNLKTDADRIPSLVDRSSIFPAYHMNKKYWITVVLTSVTDFEKLKVLTLRSKALVEK